MQETDPRSFEEFWPFYVRAHADKTNRTLHFIGTTLAMGSVAAAILARRPSLLLAAPVLGYGLAWIGHYGVQGNTPATFKHPLWSLKGDFVMWWKIATSQMDAEVERATKANGVAEADVPAASAAN
jgi:hypothetical protein